MITAKRYHDISCGHRVVGHEGKCALLHGHNYRFHFTAQAIELDKVGRVIDFSVLKSTLCQWLEDNWDHKFIAWERDERLLYISRNNDPDLGVVFVPFNPTAENLAYYMLKVIGPQILPANVRLTSVLVEETRKCSAEASL